MIIGTKIQTALGILTVRAGCITSLPSDRQMEITIHKPTLKLPKGMSVDEFQTVVLHIGSKESLRDVFYEYELENDSLKGYPETGEYLDCQSWDDGHYVLSIGTEDCEALQARLPSINW
jgi:hypothetical protein